MILIHHLTTQAFLIVKKRYSYLNKTEILKILSKALGYKSIGHLQRDYDFDEDGTFLNRKKEGEYYEDWPLDISFYGLLFNEFELMKQLKIDYSRALELKRALDRHDTFNGAYDGNIRYSDITLIETGLKMLLSGKSGRLMAEWPIRFYCKREKKYSVGYKGENKEISFIWFDGFTIIDRDYYGKLLYPFLRTFFDLLLSYDNVVFLDEMHIPLKDFEHFPFSNKNYKPFYRFIMRSYRHYEINVEFRLRKKSLLLSSTREDGIQEIPVPIHRFG